jgi:hypothetical protein
MTTPILQLAQAAEMVMNRRRKKSVHYCAPEPTFAEPGSLLEARHQLLYIRVGPGAVDAIFGVRPGSTLNWWMEGISLVQPENAYLEFNLNMVYYFKSEMRHQALAPWRARVSVRTKPFDEAAIEINTSLLRAALLQMMQDGTIDPASNIAHRDSMIAEVEAECRRQGIEH